MGKMGEFNEKIKKRKHQLAPQIMRLRKLLEVREREAIYNEKKQAYAAAKAGIDSDLGSVQQDANEALGMAAHEESQAAYYESAASIEHVKLTRAADEAGRLHRTMPDGSEVASFKDLFQYKVGQQEAASEKARDGKRVESLGGNAKQVRRELYKLLRCKVERSIFQGRIKEMEAAENQDTNIFTMPDGEDGPGEGHLLSMAL